MLGERSAPGRPSHRLINKVRPDNFMKEAEAMAEELAKRSPSLEAVKNCLMSLPRLDKASA